MQQQTSQISAEPIQLQRYAKCVVIFKYIYIFINRNSEAKNNSRAVFIDKRITNIRVIQQLGIMVHQLNLVILMQNMQIM